MNEVSINNVQLPDNMPDLSKFVLIGREKLNAVRAEIRAINRVGLAKEVYEQKLLEAQEIAEAVLDAEVKIGELTKEMKKGTNRFSSNNGVTPKKEQLNEIGLSKIQASRFEQLAKHPEAVEQAKADARETGSIVTRQNVFKRISDGYDKNKREDRELREAKKRHEEYSEKRTNDVINIADVQQDKSDSRLIYADFRDELSKAHREICYIGTLIEQNKFPDIIRGAEAYELFKLDQMMREWARVITLARRKIEELKNEKQSN